MAAIEKFARTFAITVPAFLPRLKPISRNAKPACMNITSTPATITQVELMPTVSASLPAPAASNVSAMALPGSTSAMRAAAAPMPSGHLLRATAPRVRLFIWVFPPVEARLRRTGISVLGTLGALRWRIFGQVSKIRWAGSSTRSKPPGQAVLAAGGAALDAALAHRKPQIEAVHRDLEAAVRGARGGRVGAEQLELRHVPSGEVPAVRVELPDLLTGGDGRSERAARDERLRLTARGHVPEAAGDLGDARVAAHVEARADRGGAEQRVAGALGGRQPVRGGAGLVVRGCRGTGVPAAADGIYRCADLGVAAALVERLWLLRYDEANLTVGKAGKGCGAEGTTRRRLSRTRLGARLHARPDA